eukprot:6188187-Pleurochrysis_carterae.AAC.2
MDASDFLITRVSACAKVLGECTSAVLYTLIGLTETAGSKPLFGRMLTSSWTTLLVSMFLAVSIWVSGLPFRLLGLVLPFNFAISLSSMCVLYLTQQLLPGLSGRMFFLSLRHTAPKMAEDLEAKPVIRSLGMQLVGVGQQLLLALVALLVIVPLSLVAGLPVLPLAILFSPIMVVTLAVFSVGVAFCFGVARTRFVRALISLLQLVAQSLPLGVGVVFLWLLGGLNLETLEIVCKELAYIYALAVTQSQQMLTQLSIRCTAQEWDTWCSARRRGLLGMGLLPALLLRFCHPLLSVALVECWQAAAAFVYAKLLAGNHKAGHVQNEHTE